MGLGAGLGLSAFPILLCCAVLILGASENEGQHEEERLRPSLSDHLSNSLAPDPASEYCPI